MRKISLSETALLFDCKGDFSREEIRGFSVDSRSVKPGELFFALSGDNVDGHHYLPEVGQRGAIGAVVSKSYLGQCRLSLPLLRVNDPLESLQKLAQSVLMGSKAKIIAITGSLGKTSTKEFVQTMLESKFSVGCSKGNQNSQVGLPLTILNDTSGDEEFFGFEMGMTLPRHIAKLVEIAPPDIAVITKVALVHACHFESIEEIARTKAEIFSHPKTVLGVLPRDISNFSEISQMGHSEKISFSTVNPESNYYLRLQPEPVLEVRNDCESYSMPMQVPQFSGKHHMHNVLAAAIVAYYCGMGWDEINQAIPLLRLPERRSATVVRNEIVFFNDSYNAAEESLIAAMESLPPSSSSEGKKVAVIGSINELGKYSEGCHRRVGQAALHHVEKLYCIGEECSPMVKIWKEQQRPVHFFENRNDLLHALRKELRPHDVVLLKGSNSHQLWKIVEEF